MTHDLVDLPAFTCIGLEAVGTLYNCQEWLPLHWMEFHHRTFELRNLQRLGAWGLMSDSEIHLAPWGGERGRYLASWQVPKDTAPFRDWKVWEIPALSWMRIPCRISQIGEALEYAKQSLRNHPQWRWEGSVHEFYPDDFRNPATDNFCLMVGLLPR